MPIRISSKAINIMSLDAVKDIFSWNETSDIRFLFHTNYGFITGYTVEKRPSSDDFKEYFKKSHHKDGRFSADLSIMPAIRKQYFESENITDEKVISDGSLIVLKDVKIYSDDLSSPVLQIDSFVLHCVDIIGFSLIDSSENI